MKIAFQMDPIGPIDINADSTFRLAEEAQARGYELFYYLPERLAYDEIFAGQLALMLVRQSSRRRRGVPIAGDGRLRAMLKLPLPVCASVTAALGSLARSHLLFL